MVLIRTKEIKVLKVLNTHGKIAAGWNHQALIDLQRFGYATMTALYGANGKISGTSLWSITDKGRLFLSEERAGQ